MLTERILVVDDEPSNANLVVRVLERAGYSNVRVTLDSSDVIRLVNEFKPHLLILDLHMGHTSGFDILELLNHHLDAAALLPVLVTTGDTAMESLHRARDLGADDYLLKPFSISDLILRVEGLLSMRMACKASNAESVLLRREISACRHIITQAELDLLGQMTGTSEGIDPTDGHSARVGELAASIAECMHLDAATVQSIRAAAPLHDFGKVAVSRRILMKPGPLTSDEMEIVCRHTVIGAFLLSGTAFPVLRLASEIALYHHERWDGTGYPRGLAGEDIPLAGRIVAVADVFDALTSVRSYKRAWSVRDALTEIMSKSGTQFDPRVVGALVATVLRSDTRMSPGKKVSDDSVLSLVERQRKRKLQLHAAVSAGHKLERARLVRDVARRAIVA
jgi:putative two-component system response regulator